LHLYPDRRGRLPSWLSRSTALPTTVHLRSVPRHIADTRTLLSCVCATAPCLVPQTTSPRVLCASPATHFHRIELLPSLPSPSHFLTSVSLRRPCGPQGITGSCPRVPRGLGGGWGISGRSRRRRGGGGL
jgi:hypothetical protein